MYRKILLAIIAVASITAGGCAGLPNGADQQIAETNRPVFVGLTASPAMSGNAGSPGLAFNRM